MSAERREKKRPLRRKRKMRSAGLGRMQVAVDQVNAPQKAKIELPYANRDNNFDEILAQELPMCTTMRETLCCFALVLLIGGGGIGIGIWYVVAS